MSSNPGYLTLPLIVYLIRSGGERGKQTVQDPESHVPLHVRQPRGVPETFGERVAVNLQFGYLGKHRSRRVKRVSQVRFDTSFYCLVFFESTCLFTLVLCSYHIHRSPKHSQVLKLFIFFNVCMHVSSLCYKRSSK